MNDATGHGRIVVGVDGSAASIAALREALAIAEATGARVEAIACWSVPTALAVQYALGNIDLEGGARRAFHETLVQAFGEYTPGIVSTHLVQGDARQVLPGLATGAEMLVVGRRGMGGLAGLVMGSVSQACLAHAACPVMVIPAGVAPETSGAVDGPGAP